MGKNKSKSVRAVVISFHPTFFFAVFSVSFFVAVSIFVGGSIKNIAVAMNNIVSPNANINPAILYGLIGITPKKLKETLATRVLIKGPKIIPTERVMDIMVNVVRC